MDRVVTKEDLRFARVEVRGKDYDVSQDLAALLITFMDGSVGTLIGSYDLLKLTQFGFAENPFVEYNEQVKQVSSSSLLLGDRLDDWR